MNNSAICVITINPNIEMVKFYNSFKKYDIFFIIDDLFFNTKELNEMYPNIQFIQIDNKTCNETGYIHSSYMPTSSLIFNEIIGWDRAIYFFCNIKTNYKNVWFFEDDLFIYNEETINVIDEKYTNADILCRDKNPESKPDEWQWFWPAIQVEFERPYFHSPICAVRMSQTMLSCIKKYIEKHKKMFFIEAMFPSIAHYYKLTYYTPKEFEKIVWRHDWQKEEILKSDFVHPIKDINKHDEYRIYLSLQ